MTALNVASWQQNNLRLLAEGWRICADYREDGSVLNYAVKDCRRIELPMFEDQGEQK